MMIGSCVCFWFFSIALFPLDTSCWHIHADKMIRIAASKPPISRHPRVLLTAILVLCSFGRHWHQQHHHHATAVAFDVEKDNRPGSGAGKGILFFAYGLEEQTTEHFLKEACFSAHRIKKLNPDTNITLVTNPGPAPDGDDMEGAFDLIMHVDQESLFPGSVPSWTPNGLARQWLTRLEYLSRSPYEVTLALDSQALCCASGVNDILSEGPGEFDIAFAVQGPKLLTPHNWALMYRLNDNTRRLFDRWRMIQIAKSRAGSDQGTLLIAAGSLALQDKLKVGVLAETVAMATVPYNHSAPAWPRSSPLLEPGPVHFVHYNAFTHEEEDTTCERLNRNADRARVVFQAEAMPRSPETNIRTENTWETKFSEEELAEAARAVREDALYFRGLDWENASKKWGHVATAWREHYPGCWDVLYKEVDVSIRQLLSKESIRESPAFRAEFADDRFWPLSP